MELNIFFLPRLASPLCTPSGFKKRGGREKEKHWKSEREKKNEIETEISRWCLFSRLAQPGLTVYRLKERTMKLKHYELSLFPSYNTELLSVRVKGGME